jgi:beta-carotene ketolase (CrtW type)
MHWSEKLALVAGMVVFMEVFAWGAHKYVMHGWGWGWHRSHHEPQSGAFETNDLYALTFAIIVMALFAAGLRFEPLWWAAVGISVYGGIYAFVHDIMVHQRLGLRWVPRRGYPKRLLQAHRLHHAVRGKEGGVSFGFLFARDPVHLKRQLAERPAPRRPADTASISLMLAASIGVAWIAIHVGGIFFWQWSAASGVLAVPLVLLQAWLSTGLFIVAHDCMHGSFASGHGARNTIVGTLCLGAYAGLSYRVLYPKHHMHHAAPGTDADPDFNPDAPRDAGSWFLRFFRGYYTHAQIVRITVAALVYMLLGATLLNIVVFWAIPALLALVQLFVFGTYLPHRHEAAPFADAHNARGNESSSLISLATCFHFGTYHHEHHLSPMTPWWRLPRMRRSG